MPPGRSQDPLGGNTGRLVTSVGLWEGFGGPLGAVFQIKEQNIITIMSEMMMMMMMMMMIMSEKCLSCMDSRSIN